MSLIRGKPSASDPSRRAFETGLRDGPKSPTHRLSLSCPFLVPTKEQTCRLYFLGGSGRTCRLGADGAHRAARRAADRPHPPRVLRRRRRRRRLTGGENTLERMSSPRVLRRRRTAARPTLTARLETRKPRDRSVARPLSREAAQRRGRTAARLHSGQAARPHSGAARSGAARSGESAPQHIGCSGPSLSVAYTAATNLI